MAVSPVKKTTAKPSVKKTTTAKKPAAKKAAPKKTSTKTRKISAEERYKMVEVAAYYIAEHNHFQGSPVDFWIAAEAEVAAKLA